MTLPSRVLLLLGLLASVAAQAQLTAISYDRGSAGTFIADADAASAILSNRGAGSSGCCIFGAAANAFDPFTQTMYALGPDPLDASAPWQLHAFNATTGSALPTVTLAQGGRIIGAAFEQASPRLLALRAASSGNIDLVEVDTASGALSVLNSGLADCCAATPNAVAYTNGVVYLSARLRSASTPTLFGFPVDGSAVTSVVLAGPLSVLNRDPTSGLLYAIRQSVSAAPLTASLSFVRVDPASGTLTPIGAGVADCCAIAPDIGAISGGRMTVVAQAVGATGYSLLSFDISGGAVNFSSGPIDSARIVNGLFDTEKGLEPTTTTITSIAPEPSEIGQPYTVTATVTASSGPVSGVVNVDDGIGGTCSYTLPATSCALTGTVLGPLTITATYIGQGAFIGSSDTAAHTVVQATSVTTITSIVPAGASPIGQPYTVNVAVAGFNPTGSVAVDDGAGATCSLVLPATACVLTSTSVGPRTITAAYAGDLNNTPSSGTAAYSIGQSPSVTTITSVVPAGSSEVGQPYTVNVTVTGFGTPTGSIAVDDGSGASCSIVLPAASCVLTSTSAGAKTLTATYSGDTENLPSGGTAAYTITRAPSTTTIPAIAPNPPSAGIAYSVSTSVSGFGTPTGTVAVDDGNGGNCLVTLPATGCSLTSTVAGALTLTASYSGDGNNLPSSGTFSVSVLQAATSTTLAANPDPAVVGMPVQLSATVTQPGATGVVLGGNVDFLDGATAIAGCSAIPLVAGVAQCTTSFTPSGVRNLQANYLGDPNNLASSGTLALLVDRVPTSTALVVTPNQVLRNTDVRLDITVTGGVAPLDGTVSATSNGVPIAECQNLALVGGVTSCQFRALLEGEFTIVATYSGDVDDASSSGSAGLSVGIVELPVDSRWALALLALAFLLVGSRMLRRSRAGD